MKSPTVNSMLSTRSSPTYSTTQSLKCQYPSKRCDNPRGTKRNGEPHNFCEFHRTRANFNQRRLDHKRKYQQESAPPTLLVSAEVPRDMPLFKPESLINGAPLATMLEPDEIWILQELLKIDNSRAS